MKRTLLIGAIATSHLLVACATPAPPAATPEPTPAPEATAVDETPTPAAEAAPVDAGVIPAEALMNATYSGIYDVPITLTGGLYEGKPVEGDPARPTVQYIEGAELVGDLDGDGVEDTVVFLLERGGGSGAFTYVAAQLNREGQLVDAGAVRIEDRIGVKSAAIADGQVELEIITQGPGDAACCGSHKVRKAYALQEGQLAELAGDEQELVRLSAADLAGTGWTLVELNTDQPALADTEVTINFGNGQISGSGGCNNYTGSFSLGDVSPLFMTTGPVAATQQSCPDPMASQETAYFTALERISHWGYVFGRLALYYKDDGGETGRLLFAPQATPDAGALELMPPPTEDLTMLRANPWQWVSFTSPVEAFDIEDPSSYRLTFNTDATLAITADCNDVVGFYQGESGDALTVIVGPVILADCGSGSRSDQFVKLLGSAASYFFRDGNGLLLMAIVRLDEPTKV